MLVYRAKLLLVGAALVGAFLPTGPYLFSASHWARPPPIIGLEEVFGPTGPFSVSHWARPPLNPLSALKKYLGLLGLPNEKYSVLTGM